MDSPKEMTRADIYKRGIKRFEDARKYLKDVKSIDEISSRLEMSVEQLYAILRGDRQFTVLQEEYFFAITDFPEGWILKQQFVHPLPEPISKGKKK